MPKCETCGKEFNTEEGLSSHRADKHDLSRHEKKELKKHQEEQKKEEIHSKIKRKKIKRYALVAILIVAVVAGGYFLSTLVSNPSSNNSGSVNLGPVGSTHIHQDFKMYVSGQMVDFSQPKYQLRSSLVHFENGDGNVIHTHATGMTLGYMLGTMNIELTPECLVIDGVRYCNNGNSKLKLYANGQPDNEFGSYLMKDLDKILVSYGDETGLSGQIASVTNLAKTQSERVMTP
ncbi:MAG: hypothetical protein WC613_03860 [Candidatus Aenigmatarchaeota archaeon]